MGKARDTIDAKLVEWIGRQPLFFVGTAPGRRRPRQRLAEGADRDARVVHAPGSTRFEELLPRFAVHERAEATAPSSS